MKIERLTEAERAYHARLVVMMRSAQSAWEVWQAHLIERYGLSGADTIDEAGRIRRTEEP